LSKRQGDGEAGGSQFGSLPANIWPFCRKKGFDLREESHVPFARRRVQLADMKPLGVFSLLVVSLTLASGLFAEERGPLRPNGDRLAGSLPGNKLFKAGEKSATFQLSEVDALDRPSPELELLFSSANQQAIATLLKEERNKSRKPGQVPPDDQGVKGIKIRFDAIRFLRDENHPDLVRVRLVGPINEVECQQPLSISKLLESLEGIPVQFQSVTRNTGVTVTITTDMKLKWDEGNLAVNGTQGTIDFTVGRLSPARLFYSSDTDSVKLPDLYGKRVSENTLVPRSLLEPEKL
jgi:hypothetical protein